MIQSKPTIYKGRNYRSQLEAKWAAFFDRCGWRHEYEPFETYGWIPDFMIFGKEEPLLVEIKPYSSLLEFEKLMIPKIEKSLWGHPYYGSELLLLGTCPFKDEYGAYCIGYIGEFFEGYNFSDAALSLNPGGKLGICSSSMSYRDRITGYYDGNCQTPTDPDQWIDACNTLQWHPRNYYPEPKIRIEKGF